MSRGFQLQVLAIGDVVWYRDTSEFGQVPKVTESKSIEDLRASIQDTADKRTLSRPLHVRIVTEDGHAVERWKVRPGLAKKLRRRV